MVAVRLFGELEVVHGGVAVPVRGAKQRALLATLVTGSTGGIGRERHYSGQQAYNQSKLANVMFTYELGRRLDGTGVTATVLHPGVVRTAFAAEDPSLLAKVMITVSRPFLKTPAQGAATAICLSGRRHKRLAVLRPGRVRQGAD
jgi:hypothetical protein